MAYREWDPWKKYDRRPLEGEDVLFKSVKIALAVAKHSVMGGMYTSMRDSGIIGILIEVPLHQIRYDDASRMYD